jgi:arsenate reductase (glutaredoxin)
MLRIYTYQNCSTCREAVKWLRSHGHVFEEIPIRERPPSRTELHAMLGAQGNNLRRLFNTSGRDYRALKLGETLDGLSPPAALALLEQNGNLVKRPFLLGPKIALIGFDETVWSRAFKV